MCYKNNTCLSYELAKQRIIKIGITNFTNTFMLENLFLCVSIKAMLFKNMFL